MCEQKKNCMIMHKAMEHGDGASSGVPALFDRFTASLSESDINYIEKWETMLRIEEGDPGAANRSIWTLSPSEREQEGRCLAFLSVTNYMPVSTGRNYQFTQAPSRSTPNKKVDSPCPVSV